jgi:hypothetical protein
MISTNFVRAALALLFAGVSVPAFSADAERGVVTINRHQLAAAKELEAYRLYEQDTHPKVLNAGTFLIGSGGSVNANNDAVPTPTRQSAPLPLKGGVDHLIIVSCDEDCLLLNVRVFDAAGKMVGQDVSPTRTTSRYMVKQVQLVPASDQTYRVETEIACRQGSRGGCSFAIGANTK